MKDTAGRWANRAAHWFRWAFLVMVVAWVLSWVYPPLYSWIVFATAAMIITWFLMTWHQSFGGLCIPCMIEVPADASQQAQRWGRLLWVWHVSKTRRGNLSWLAAVVISTTLRLLTHHESDLVGRLINLPTDLWLFAMCWSDWKHHKLMPWCPQCKDWGDGGLYEPSPDPVNTEVMS